MHDGLGSVTDLLGYDSQIKASYQYDAFGNYRSKTETDTVNDFGFTGHEMDDETSLVYMKARFYDPDSGRFLTEDTYLGQQDTPPSLNRYLYAYGNPTRYIDPDGRTAIGQEAKQYAKEQAELARQEGVETQKQSNKETRGKLVLQDSTEGVLSKLIKNPAATGAGVKSALWDMLGDAIGLADYTANEIGQLANKVGLVSDEDSAKYVEENKEGLGRLVENTVNGVMQIDQTVKDVSGLIEKAGNNDPEAIADLARMGTHVGVGSASAIGGAAVTANAARTANQIRRLADDVPKSLISAEKSTYSKFSDNTANRKHINLNQSINERGLVAQERALAESAGWIRADGSTWWPPYDGAIPGTQRNISLSPASSGEPLNLIDRYGKSSGSYVAPAGTPLGCDHDLMFINIKLQLESHNDQVFPRTVPIVL